MAYPDLSFRFELPEVVRRELGSFAAQTQSFLAKEHHADGSHDLGDVVVDSLRIRTPTGSRALVSTDLGDVVPWTHAPFDAATYTASAGTWTAIAASQASYRYTQIGAVLMVQGTIIGTSVSATPLTLSLKLPPGVTLFGSNVAGFLSYSQDGFATRDSGLARTNVGTNTIDFSTRTGAAWATTVALTGLLFSVVAECVPAA